VQEPASARRLRQHGLWGQQTWCDARADGHSPDERDRDGFGRCMGARQIAVRWPDVFARALILANPL
jgi:hypothetical protein